MLSIIKGLLGFKGIAEKIADAYVAKQAALTDRERIVADERIKTLEMQRDVLIAEQRSWLTSWVRPAFAFPFVVYSWKLVIWDKVLKLGTTDPLSENLTEIMVVIIGAFFIARPFEKVGQAWAARRK